MEKFSWFTFIFYFIGMWVTFKLLLSLWRRQEEDNSNNLEDDDDHVVVVNIEKYGDIYYLFDKDTDAFMAQGKTEEELKDVVTKRFPGKRFMAAEKNLEELGLKF